jgi:hypothetical protein
MSGRQQHTPLAVALTPRKFGAAGSSKLVSVMKRTLTSRLLAGVLSAADVQALRSAADGFKRAAQAGMERPALLKGKHIAVLSDGPVSEEGRDVARAATLLGARVSELGIAALLDGSRADASMRMLPRLYDLVWCDGLPAQRARALQAGTGVPVWSGLGALQPNAAESEDRVYLAQALLMNTLAGV